MTRKSASRRAADAARAKASGGKLPSARVVREKSTRAWYELKTIHARSQAYIQQLAERVQQYMNPIVIMKIDKNGDKARFDELLKDLTTNAMKTGVEFAALWDMHKDKKKLCLSAIELEQAMRVGEMYQAFDTDFYLTFSPIINELNAIFNKALKMLLDAKEELEKNQAGQTEKDLIDPTVVSDVNYAEVKAEDIPLPASQSGLIAPRGMTDVIVHQDEFGNVLTPVSADPHNTETFQKDLSKSLEEVEINSSDDSNNVPMTQEVAETLDAAGEDIVIDPSMRHGLIRPNI